MSKTKKNKGKVKIKQNKTTKHKIKELILPNLTPLSDRQLSNNIAKGIKHNNSLSYRPSINQFLVSLRTMRRKEIVDCNNKAAFDLKATDYIAIQRKFKDICQKVNKRLAGFDGWICPTIPQVAPPVKGYDSPEKIADWNRINTANTRPANLFGQCGISLPMRGVLTGLPLGFQIMAAPVTDDRLLRTAITVERLIGQGS